MRSYRGLTALALSLPLALPLGCRSDGITRQTLSDGTVRITETLPGIDVEEYNRERYGLLESWSSTSTTGTGSSERVRSWSLDRFTDRQVLRYSVDGKPVQTWEWEGDQDDMPRVYSDTVSRDFPVTRSFGQGTGLDYSLRDDGE